MTTLFLANQTYRGALEPKWLRKNTHTIKHCTDSKCPLSSHRCTDLRHLLLLDRLFLLESEREKRLAAARALPPLLGAPSRQRRRRREREVLHKRLPRDRHREPRDVGLDPLRLDEGLHAPLLQNTKHMLGARELTLMQDGSTLINTSRGAIIDQTALEIELAKGRIFAILDTTDPDELPASSPLFSMPNVFLTPHIAGSLGAETQRLTDYIVAELERFNQGLGLKHLVRREHLAQLG